MSRFFWTEKYRPKCFDEFKFHQNEAERLKRLVKEENFPHILLYGPNGSGKRTIVRSLLYEIFGASSRKLKIEKITFDAPSGKKIMQTFLSSNLHLEVNPSENGYYDRVVVQELIKNMATNLSVIRKHSFRMVIIDEADSLTKEAQQALRRTMEKYSDTCRIVMVVEHCSRIISALRSRCLMIRCAAPSTDELINILQTIAKAERLNLNDNESIIMKNIINESDHNVRKAIFHLQKIVIEKELKTNRKKSINNQLEIFCWQQKVADIINIMAKCQSVKQVSQIREILYDLQLHLISANTILRTLLCSLMDYCLDDKMKAELINIAAEIDHRLQQGSSKSILYLELFVIKFMRMFRCTVEKVAIDFEEQ